MDRIYTAKSTQIRKIRDKFYESRGTNVTTAALGTHRPRWNMREIIQHLVAYNYHVHCTWKAVVKE